jgi:Leucine-rich repeat (LRR) protein
MKNNINGEGAIALIKLNQLISLNLNNNQIINDQIANALGNSTSLREVYLDQSQFTTNGHAALIANKNIKILSLNKCQINSETAKRYAASEILVELYLDENNLDEGSLRELANNQILLKLSVRYNNINDAIAVAFSLNNKLRHLDLSHNKIKSIGAKAFANTTIENLNLSDNIIDDTTPAALSSNPNLKSADLSYNDLSIDALKTLYEVNPMVSYNAAVKIGAKPYFPSLLRLSTFAVKNISNLPEAALKQLPADIQEYLKNRKV